jgi:hypothetical protein
VNVPRASETSPAGAGTSCAAVRVAVTRICEAAWLRAPAPAASASTRPNAIAVLLRILVFTPSPSVAGHPSIRVRLGGRIDSGVEELRLDLGSSLSHHNWYYPCVLSQSLAARSWPRTSPPGFRFVWMFT